MKGRNIMYVNGSQTEYCAKITDMTYICECDLYATIYGIYLLVWKPMTLWLTDTGTRIQYTYGPRYPGV